ncbi:MAG: zinc transport system substrate-binding protein, partial [Actinomycetota bacterium]|nr:zinc transport system substrate-binding protein [Actinomycetota bacterium]
MRIIPIRVSAAVLVAGVLLATAACSGTGGGGSGGRVSVVAAFFPMAEVARNVGGAHVDVQTLTPPGVEPHDLELNTRQVQEAHDADVLVYLSHGFQPAVSDLVSQVTGRTVDALAGLPVVGDDPHVWLDPVLLQRIVGKVQGALAQADPAHSSDYATNARRYRAQLSALDRRFATGLANCDRNIMVTSHAAYLYLSSRYGLEQEAVTG